MIYNEILALTFDDVTIEPGYSDIYSRKEVDISWTLASPKKKFSFSIPVIASNMTTICGESMAAYMSQVGGLGIIHRFMTVNSQLGISERWQRDKPRSGPLAHSVGSVLNDRERIDLIIQEDGVDILCVDIAHGDSIHMERTLKHIRDKGFEGPIIAGNVCTRSAATALQEWGADMIKVGIGPGSVCTTRIKTGVGIPQFQTVFSTVPSGAPICADGGIRYPGDAAKALAVGATTVMIGGMLAGTDMVPGYEATDQLYHAGNASSKVKKSFQQHNANAEGVAKPVAKRGYGSTARVITDLVEGIKSTCSYVGARNLEELRKKAVIRRVTPAAVRENIPHFNGADLS